MSIFDDAFSIYGDVRELVGLCNEATWERLKAEHERELRGTDPTPWTVLWLLRSVIEKAKSA